ncbi:16267_t:CDS:2, partial [Cetraspora pellucida]
PTSHTLYELVFGQHPLHQFNIIEELKQYNINIEEDLLQNMVRSEEDLENMDNNNGLHYNNSLYNNNSDFNNMDNDEQSPTHHDIYCQLANKNLEDYCSKIECQMYTKYNIQEHNYQVGDLVKIQIAKIDCEPGNYCALSCKVFLVLSNNMYHLVYRFGVFERAFLADKVLPLGPKEFSKLNNLLIYKNGSIVEAARLQSNAFASNKGCNYRGDCLMAKCFL